MAAIPSYQQLQHLVTCMHTGRCRAAASNGSSKMPGQSTAHSSTDSKNGAVRCPSQGASTAVSPGLATPLLPDRSAHTVVLATSMSMEMGPHPLTVHAVTAPYGKLVRCQECRSTSHGVLISDVSRHLGPRDVAHVVLVVHGRGGRVGGQRQRFVVDEAGAPLLALNPLPHLGVALPVLLSPLGDPDLPCRGLSD